MAYLTEYDLHRYYEQKLCSQLVEGNYDLYWQHEADGIEWLRSNMGHLYDLGAEFDRKGNKRERNLVRCLAVYCIYHAMTRWHPEKVSEVWGAKYDDMLKWVKDVNASKAHLNLEPRQNADLSPRTNMIIGSPYEMLGTDY